MVSTHDRCALVTGGTGYIGGILTDLLRRSVSLSRVHSVGSDGLDVTDIEDVRRTVDKAGPDFVFHLAAKADTDWCEDHFEIGRAHV